MTERKNIIRKALDKVKSSFNDDEKSSVLADKHNLPVIYRALGSDLVHGAASNYDKEITIKDAYTPKTIAARAARRMVTGAVIGAGLSYMNHDDLDASTILKDASAAAAVGAAVGAVTGPALMYTAGKSLEKLRQKTITKLKGSKK